MARDNSGWQPLHLASMNGDLDAVHAILQRSENGIMTCINSTTSDGQTALMIAKTYNRHDLIARLQDFQSFRARLMRINFDGVIPDHMKSCISYEIINDPITVSSGITYDRAELSQCFGHNSRIKCPMTMGFFIHRQELQFKSTVFLKTLIEAFVTEQENAFQAQRTLIEGETSAGASFRL